MCACVLLSWMSVRSWVCVTDYSDSTMPSALRWKYGHHLLRETVPAPPVEKSCLMMKMSCVCLAAVSFFDYVRCIFAFLKSRKYKKKKKNFTKQLLEYYC